MEKKIITVEQALGILPEKDIVHTFHSQPGMPLVGADWGREEVEAEIRQEGNTLELAGPSATSMGHGLAISKTSNRPVMDALLIETDPVKLEALEKALVAPED